jgi:hypothetical protein
MNLRQLRDTRKLKAWLRAGKSVELKERDRVIGRIVPETHREIPVKYPDFAARAKKIFGDQVLTVVDDFIKDRGRY